MPVEILTLAAFLQAAVFFALVVAAALTDVSRGRIPVAPCAAAALAGLMLATLRGGVWSGIDSVSFGSHALAALTAFGLFFAAWRAGGIGLGDAYLAGGVGALAGVRLTVWILALGSLAGFALAVGMLLVRGGLRAGFAGAGRNSFRLRYVGPTEARASGSRETPSDPESAVPWRVPYAAAILVGSLGAVWIWLARGEALPFG